MGSDLEILEPPIRLALVHARPDGRELLEFMLQMDRRLGSILVRTNEPLIGQMRIAWWRDVIGKKADERPSGEPLITRMNILETEKGQGILRPATIRLLDAWEMVIADRNWSADQLIKMSGVRGQAIFSPYVAEMGNVPHDSLNYWTSRWAFADLRTFCTAPDLRSRIPDYHVEGTAHRLPYRLRPASILAHAAEGQGRFSGLRLLWHALTGY